MEYHMDLDMQNTIYSAYLGIVKYKIRSQEALL